MILGLIFFRILFDFIYLPIKAVSGNSYKEKTEGIKVAKLTENTNLYYFGRDFLPSGFVFYVEREKRKILFKKLDIQKGNFYIVKGNKINENLKKLAVYSFKLKDNTYFLIKP